MISHHAATPSAVACHAVDLAGGAPEWVHLLPAGTFQGRDGRGPYQLRDATKVIEATLARQAGADAVVDFEHQTDNAPKNGQPAPAAGWIKALEARADGIWAQVEWTERAKALLEAKEYRYLSPTFTHTKDGTVRTLLRAALTNAPNLDLIALASAQPEGERMDLKELAKALGLPEDSDLEAITQHATALVASNAAHAEEVAQFAALAGLDKEAKSEDVLTALQTQQAEAAKTKPDPSKFVPMSEFEQLATAMHRLEETVARGASEDFVAEHKDKIPPAMQEHIVALHKTDPERAEKLVASMPALVNGQSFAGDPPGGSAHATDTEDTALCNALGISTKEFQEAGKEDA